MRQEEEVEPVDQTQVEDHVEEGEQVQQEDQVHQEDPVERLQPAKNVEDVEEFVKPSQPVKVFIFYFYLVYLTGTNC